MNELKVPKNRTKVTIYFNDNSKLSGEIFLYNYCDTRQGCESVSDILEGKKTYIPFLRDEHEESELINKYNICILEKQESDSDVEEKISIGLVRELHARVVFKEGNAIAGTIISNALHNKTRLSDCMNLADKFLVIKKNSRIMHINKAMIYRVEQNQE